MQSQRRHSGREGGSAPPRGRGGQRASLRGSLATLASVETVLASNKTPGGGGGGGGLEDGGGGDIPDAFAGAAAAADAVGAAAKPQASSSHQQQSQRQQHQQQFQKQQAPRGAGGRWGQMTRVQQGMASYSTLSTAASSTRSMMSHVSIRQMASTDEDSGGGGGGGDRGGDGLLFANRERDRALLGASFATLGSIPDDYTGNESSSAAISAVPSSSAVSAAPSGSGASASANNVDSIGTSDRCVCDEDELSECSDLTSASGSTSQEGGHHQAAAADAAAAYLRPAAQGRRRSKLFCIPDDIEFSGYDEDEDEDKAQGVPFEAEGAPGRRRSSILTIPDELMLLECDDEEEAEEEQEEDAKPPAAIGPGATAVGFVDRTSSDNSVKSGDKHGLDVVEPVAEEVPAVAGLKRNDATMPPNNSGTDLSSVGSVGTAADDLTHSTSGTRKRMRRSKSDRAVTKNMENSHSRSLESVRKAKSDRSLDATGAAGGANEEWDDMMPILDPEDGPKAPPPAAASAGAAATAASSGAAPSRDSSSLASAPRRAHHHRHDRPGLESDGDNFALAADAASVGARSVHSTSSLSLHRRSRGGASRRHRHARMPSDGSFLDRLLSGTLEPTLAATEEGGGGPPANDEQQRGGGAASATGGGAEGGGGSSANLYDWNRPNAYLNQAPSAAAGGHRAIGGGAGERNTAPRGLGLDGGAAAATAIAQNSSLRGGPLDNSAAPRASPLGLNVGGGGLGSHYNRPGPPPIGAAAGGGFETSSSSLLESLRELDLRSLPQVHDFEGVGGLNHQASLSSVPASIRSAPTVVNNLSRNHMSSVSFLDSLQSLDLRQAMVMDQHQQQRGIGDDAGASRAPGNDDHWRPSPPAAAAAVASDHHASSFAAQSSSSGSILDRLQSTDFRTMLQHEDRGGGGPPGPGPNPPSELSRFEANLTPSVAAEPAPQLARGAGGSFDVTSSSFTARANLASSVSTATAMATGGSSFLDHLQGTTNFRPRAIQGSGGQAGGGGGGLGIPQVSSSASLAASVASAPASSSSMLDRIQNSNGNIVRRVTPEWDLSLNRPGGGASSARAMPSANDSGTAQLDRRGRQHRQQQQQQQRLAAPRGRRSITLPPSRADRASVTDSSRSILDCLQNTDFRRLVHEREQEEMSLQDDDDATSIDPRGPRSISNGDNEDNEDNSIDARIGRSLASEYSRLAGSGAARRRGQRRSITIPATRREEESFASSRQRQPARRTSSITLPVRNGNAASESVFDRIQQLVDDEDIDMEDDDDGGGDARAEATAAAAVPPQLHSSSRSAAALSAGRTDDCSPPKRGRLPATQVERRAHVLTMQQMRRASPTPLMRVLGVPRQQGGGGPPASASARGEDQQGASASTSTPGLGILDSLQANPVLASSSLSSLNFNNINNDSISGPSGSLHFSQRSILTEPPSRMNEHAAVASAEAPYHQASSLWNSAPSVVHSGKPSAAVAAAAPSAAAPSSSSSSAGLSPLYLAVSSCAPPDAVRSLIESDPSSVGRQNRGGLTPLHCAIDRYDTPLSVIRMLLVARPRTAGVRSREGRTPLDLLWKRLFDPEPYRSGAVREAAARLRETMEAVVAADGCDDGEEQCAEDMHEGSSGDDCEDKKPCHRERSRKANAIRALYSSVELRRSWDVVTAFVRAARYGTVDEDAHNHSFDNDGTGSSTRFRLVHSAAALGACPPLLLRFAAALNPDQVRVAEDLSGRLPLHLAAAAWSGTVPAAGGDSDDDNVVDLDDVGADDWEYEETISTLVELYPEATRIRDAEGRLPLNLAVESRKPWGAIRAILLACPRALVTRDVKTCMPPFMISAVGEGADLDIIYRLLRENPLEVSRGLCG